MLLIIQSSRHPGIIPSKPRHARMDGQSRQVGFRMTNELVGSMNPSSSFSFAQRIIFPLQYDREDTIQPKTRRAP